jgi:hypothetical protein
LRQIQFSINMAASQCFSVWLQEDYSIRGVGQSISEAVGVMVLDNPDIFRLTDYPKEEIA